MSGMMPGTMPGMTHGMMPGFMPGMMPGMVHFSAAVSQMLELASCGICASGRCFSEMSKSRKAWALHIEAVGSDVQIVQIVRALQRAQGWRHDARHDARDDARDGARGGARDGARAVARDDARDDARGPDDGRDGSRPSFACCASSAVFGVLPVRQSYGNFGALHIEAARFDV